MSTILSIDQGTTSSRAVLYNARSEPIASAQQEFPQYFPQSAWVEHDAEEIWQSVVHTVREVLERAQIQPSAITTIGITNQRESVVLWDRTTGKPLHRAIVWQDRRTASALNRLRERGGEEMIRKKTGLLLDPYFSASKIQWLLDTIPDARARAKRGEIAAGTVDSWLLFRLTAGAVHATDVGNASRTMLMDLRRMEWDEELLELFQIPRQLLPKIVSNSELMGTTEKSLFGAEIPIHGMIGDQQSALFGQLCTEAGQVKCTYGTGCFMLMTLENEPVNSASRLLSTVAWKMGSQPVRYALEGSVFVAGAAIQWLRDGLKIIQSASEVNDLAAQVSDSGGLVLVPAFTGLGAPHWDSSARGTLLGITRATTAAHLARATLEGIAFQVTDLLGAMQSDSGRIISTLRVDGGACASDLLMQIQSDLLDVRVERPVNIETTSLGAALMAGCAAGVWSLGDLSTIRKTERTFTPQMKSHERTEKVRTWRKAVGRAQRWEES